MSFFFLLGRVNRYKKRGKLHVLHRLNENDEKIQVYSTCIFILQYLTYKPHNCIELAAKQHCQSVLFSCDFVRYRHHRRMIIRGREASRTAPMARMLKMRGPTASTFRMRRMMRSPPLSRNPPPQLLVPALSGTCFCLDTQVLPGFRYHGDNYNIIILHKRSTLDFTIFLLHCRLPTCPCMEWSYARVDHVNCEMEMGWTHHLNERQKTDCEKMGLLVCGQGRLSLIHKAYMLSSAVVWL